MFPIKKQENKPSTILNATFSPVTESLSKLWDTSLHKGTGMNHYHSRAKVTNIQVTQHEQVRVGGESWSLLVTGRTALLPCHPLLSAHSKIAHRLFTEHREKPTSWDKMLGCWDDQLRLGEKNNMGHTGEESKQLKDKLGCDLWAHFSLNKASGCLLGAMETIAHCHVTRSRGMLSVTSYCNSQISHHLLRLGVHSYRMLQSHPATLLYPPLFIFFFSRVKQLGQKQFGYH